MNRCSCINKYYNKQCNTTANTIITIITKNWDKKIFGSIHNNMSKLLLFKHITSPAIYTVQKFLTYSLDIPTQTWKRCADSRRDRTHFTAIYFRGEIYAISTLSVIAAGTVEKYNRYRNVWTQVPNLPQRLQTVAAAVVDNELYVCGGAINDRYSDTVYKFYDPSTDPYNLHHADDNECEWLELYTWRMLQPRYRHAAIGYRGKLWIAGGFCFDKTITKWSCTSTVEIFDISTEKWETGPCMVARRDFPNLLICNDKLYAIGGDVDSVGNQATRTIEMFNEKTNRWELVANFKDDRKGFSTCAVGSKVYVFGGKDSQSYNMNTWDCYDVEHRVWESDVKQDVFLKMPVIDDWGQAVPVSDFSW